LNKLHIKNTPNVKNNSKIGKSRSNVSFSESLKIIKMRMKLQSNDYDLEQIE